MKETIKFFKQGIIVGITSLIIICAGFYIFIKARQSSSSGLPTDSNPSALYVNSNETLTSAKWNAVINKISQINYDGTATTINGTLDLDYRICEVFNPTKSNVYNCDGTINTNITNTSYTYYSNPATDLVDILCPTGYITMSGGGVSTNYMRESRTLGGTRRRIASGGTISVISVSCVKIK